MKTRRSWLCAAAIWILASVIVQPVSLDAQCIVAATGMYNLPPTISVTKTLAVSGTCREVGRANVLTCFPAAAPVPTKYLVAAASSGAMNPFCSWSCMCGGSPTTIRVDGSDGLPVELMEFSIE